MNQQSLDEITAAFFREVMENCIPRIAAATVSIVGFCKPKNAEKSQFVHGRTGVLYCIADEHFILTANHDHRREMKHVPFFVSVNEPGVLPIDLEGARFMGTEEEIRDVAAIWIPPSAAAEIRKHKQFIPHRQVILSTRGETSPRIIFGYPTDWLTLEDGLPLSRPLIFAVTDHAGDTDEYHRFDQKVHIALHFDRNAVGINCGNELLPKPYGISGCGIWKIGDGLKVRTADSLTLVGIQHHWFEKREYIQGTHVGYALAVILEHFPHLRAAMSLVYPG